MCCPRLLFPFGALYGVIASPPPVGIILVKTREPHGGRENHEFWRIPRRFGVKKRINNYVTYNDLRVGRQGLEPRYNMSVSIPFSPNRREPHGGRRFKYEKNQYYCQCKSNKCVINSQAICVKLCKILSSWKYCILHYMCAKTKLHTVNDVCKNCNRRNKIAHTPPSVQK